LLRFFALYYAGTSLASFLLQALSSRRVLERCGLALTISSPSVALLAGSIGGLVAPGFASLAAGRAGESIFRGSWFRAGYELFYTPIAASERRAAKSIIDVGCDRLGDALGGGLVRLVLLLAPASQSSVVLALALLSAVGAIVAASRLNHWYMRELEDSLVEQAGGSSGSDRTAEDSTRNILLRMADREGGPLSQVSAAHDVSVRFSAGDRELQDILALRSRSRRRIIEVLSRDEGVSAALVPHVLPLLAWNPVADYAFFALRKVAEERVGALIDTLLDPAQDYAVRRRLARVFSVCVSQRAADGLLLALDDARFDVRFQSARSLAAILDKNAGIHIDRKRIYAVVLREVAVGRPVWESGRFLDGFVGDSPLDEFVRDRASQSLAHVFTLLSLVLPREPLQIAFRSLHSEDRHLRGTALEYLEGVLPPAIRPRLWPFLVPADTPPPARHHDDVIADLLRSSDSITLDGLARRSEGPIAGFEPA
ncbi:MAG: hypothetical protein ABUS56_11350, partial [Acidobacteriota bacterium]